MGDEGTSLSTKIMEGSYFALIMWTSSVQYAEVRDMTADVHINRDKDYMEFLMASSLSNVDGEAL